MSSSNVDSGDGSSSSSVHSISNSLLNGLSRSVRSYVGAFGKTEGNVPLPDARDTVKFDDLDYRNQARIFELYREASQASQNSDQVKVYYDYLKKRWDELAQYNSLAEITGMTPTIAKAIDKQREEQKIYQFLMGLRPEFEMLSTQILNTSPLLSLAEVYALAEGDERRHLLSSTSVSVYEVSPSLDQMAFAVNSESRPLNFSSGNRKREPFICTHCGVTGHIKDRCWKLHPELRPKAPFQNSTKIRTSRSAAVVKVSPVTPSHVPTEISHLNSRIDQLFSLVQNSHMPSSSVSTTMTASDDITPSSGTSSLKILTYNVWFREDLEIYKRMKALGDLIQQHSPDVICFQEVTPKIFDIFQQCSWWKSYRCSISSETWLLYFCIQLSKVPVKSFSRSPFSCTGMGRELHLAEIDVKEGKSLVVATSHLESPFPSPPTHQMFSKERVGQANEAITILDKLPNVLFGGDMNWDDKLDGKFPLRDGWVDAWAELKPGEDGYTYDTKSNKMLSADRKLQKRLDRWFCKLQDYKISDVDIIGTEAIPGLSYCVEKKVKGAVKKLILPVLPSNHYGLLLTICRK